MKIQLLIAGVLALFSSATYAQVTNLGKPISWKGKVTTNVDVPIERMPGFNLAQTQAEDIVKDAAKDAPWRFGHKYETNISLLNNGVWTELPGGNRLWRTEIKASGALTINLTLKDVHFPKGAHLNLYNVEKTQKIGAYTSRNNHSSRELGTDLIHGDHIVVEYFEPAAVRGQGAFTINGVTHGYRSLNIIQKNLTKALNSSGDCNYDARCPVDPYISGVSAWDDQIRSVAMIVVNGSGICTGALINNSCNDGTPYFLTANHCLGGGTGNWLFRFNWDIPEGNAGMSCATTASTPVAFNNAANYEQTTVNGATTLVSGTQADHALLLLDNMTVGDATNWGVFYAGWNNDDTESTVDEVTGIHHPSGDIKKICRAYENGASNNIHHSSINSAAVWLMDAWDEGVTEPGSSGSPLFDQNGRIIGQLYGGSAACSGTSTQGYDFYGRLGISWDLGIGDYLDPVLCGGTNVANDGWDPNTSPCNSIFSYTVVEPMCAESADGAVTVVFVTGNAAGATFDIGSGTQPSATFTGLSIANYNIDIIESNACQTSLAVVLNGPNPLASSSIVTNDITGGGGEIDLTVSGGTATYSYIWTGPNGFTATTEDLTGLEDGSYGVTITDDNGCITTLTNIIVDATMGIGETDNSIFAVYPNPTNGIINVRMTEQASNDFKVHVTDVTGRIIYNSHIAGASFNIDLSSAADGTYFLHVVTSQKHTAQPIVLKK